MKQSRLKSDPAKTREWQQRSRAELASDPAKQLKRTTQLKSDPAKQLARSAPKRPAARPKRAAAPGERRTLKAALAAVEFKARVPANRRKCGRCPRSHRKHATSHHHWLEQTDLRKLMHSLARRAGWTHEHAQARLAGWLNDERNLTPMCTGCHEKGGNSMSTRRFRWHEVPPGVLDFCDDVDDELEAAGLPREATVILTRQYR